jgi:predicted Zn-dependent protease
MFSQRQLNFLKVLAHLFMQYGKAEKAATILEMLRLASPADSWIVRMLALAQLQSGDANAALGTVDLSLGMERDHEHLATSELIRSRAYWALGNAHEARQALARYQELAGGKGVA